MEASEAVLSDAVRLRAESDAFRAHLERLTELEDQKRQLSPADPTFLTLAVEVEQLAAAVLADAQAQKSVGVDAHVAGVTTPIEEVPADLTAFQILERWRAAERRLEALPQGSADARTEEARVAAFRRAYQALYARRTKSD